MNKKEYQSPSLKIVMLNDEDIICTSGGLKVWDAVVGDYAGEDEDIRDIWGTQW